MRRFFAYMAFSFGLLLFPAAHGASLDAEQQKTIAKITDYLNGLKTLESNFAQISSNGAFADGKVFMKRPGLMRLTYNPPTLAELVVRNGTIIYHDKEYKNVSYYPLSSTPLSVLLAENLSLNEDVNIIDLARAPGVIELTLSERDDPATGTVTLVFADKPLELRKWSVRDAQGIVTTVALLDPVMGAKIDPDIFKFDNPQYDRID